MPKCFSSALWHSAPLSARTALAARGVQEQGWGQLDPVLCIRLLYSPGGVTGMELRAGFSLRLVLLAVLVNRNFGRKFGWCPKSSHPSERRWTWVRCVVCTRVCTDLDKSGPQQRKGVVNAWVFWLWSRRCVGCPLPLMLSSGSQAQLLVPGAAFTPWTCGSRIHILTL